MGQGYSKIKRICYGESSRWENLKQDLNKISDHLWEGNLSLEKILAQKVILMRIRRIKINYKNFIISKALNLLSPQSLFTHRNL